MSETCVYIRWNPSPHHLLRCSGWLKKRTVSVCVSVPKFSFFLPFNFPSHPMPFLWSQPSLVLSIGPKVKRRQWMKHNERGGRIKPPASPHRLLLQVSKGTVELSALKTRKCINPIINGPKNNCPHSSLIDSLMWRSRKWMAITPGWSRTLKVVCDKYSKKDVKSSSLWISESNFFFFSSSPKLSSSSASSHNWSLGDCKKFTLKPKWMLNKNYVKHVTSVERRNEKNSSSS